MSDEKQVMQELYTDYYKCTNPRCGAVYHKINFRGKDFNCRDCGRDSLVPPEVVPRRRERKK